MLAKEKHYPRYTPWPETQMVELTLKPIHKETIVGSTAQSERKRNSRNVHQNLIGKINAKD